MTSDSTLTVKDRGAFFTPPEISTFLTRWALNENPEATILDPTSGEGAFLLAAAKELRGLGSTGDLTDQLFGADIHPQSIAEAKRLLARDGASATIMASDFFEVAAPDAVLEKLTALVEEVVDSVNAYIGEEEQDAADKDQAFDPKIIFKSQQQIGRLEHYALQFARRMARRDGDYLFALDPAR